MSRKVGVGEFGVPKPLVGQAGYKTSEAMILEKEAKEMEIRLRMLQERMQTQNLEDSAATLGGTTGKWKSSNQSKGSLIRYGKDVKEKHIKKFGNEDPVLRATAGERRTKRQIVEPSIPVGNYSVKDVNHWSISDVSDWLTGMNLQTYVSVFSQNEMSGPILLDISLSDLDYMGITILGHRKIILKSIEDLRKNKKITMNLLASPTKVSQTPVMDIARSHSADMNLSGRHVVSKSYDGPLSSKISASSLHEEALKAERIKEENSKVHWSHLEPLSSNIVENNSFSAINPADGPLDEAAEHAAFMDAVLEWRGNNGNKKVTIERENGNVGNSGNSPRPNADSMWHNPFGSDDVDSDLLSSTPHLSPRMVNNNNNLANDERLPTGPYQQFGPLDEKKEHQEFVNAVQAWREGKPHQASSAILSVADLLAQKLEEDQKLSEDRLNRVKEIATQKLKDATFQHGEKLRLQQEKDNKVSNDVKFEDMDDDDDLTDEYYGSYSNNVNTTKKILNLADILNSNASEYKTGDKSPRYSSSSTYESSLSPRPNHDDDDDDDKFDAGQSPNRKIEILLAESILGVPKYDEQNESEGNYYVDEGSDDE